MSGRRRPKIEALIVNAIRKLQDAQGLTPREISNYITQEYDVPGTEIKKQVHLALKRGVSYGILRKYKGGYYTCNQDFLKKQPINRNEINEFSCPPKRRLCRPRRRQSRRRCKRVCRKIQRRRSACKRRRPRRRSVCRRRNRSRRRKRSGRRCGTSEFNEMEAISKQPRPNSGDDDDNNSRNESISDRSSLTDPDGSMQDPRPNTPPSTHME
uniref:protamine-like protein n=1 Tax=Vespula vulgaris TaxID=7454 RepID=UPI00213658B2|nr:protamine-like protein [Vespula vulgaris]XP_050853901.1 protamine-like protein [Vespula vulgaris]XP_050853902.1 protamine-like protein [Vespula vulgaris]